MGGIGQNILREIREDDDWKNWVDTPIEEILEKVAKENAKKEKEKRKIKLKK